VSSSAERERALSVRVDSDGIVRLTWAEGLRPRPVPSRFFTADPAAVAWLCHGDARS
jgi:hypothetical protein